MAQLAGDEYIAYAIPARVAEGVAQAAHFGCIIRRREALNDMRKAWL